MGKESCACIERSKVIVIRTIVKKTWYERNKNMTLLTYQVFKTVADHGSFRKAADILGLTPSAISHAISSMENELGFSVLNRSKAGVTLTNYGENLLPYARHPYTWALLSSMPQMGIKGEDLFNIVGTPPNLFAEIRGDAFACHPSEHYTRYR